MAELPSLSTVAEGVSMPLSLMGVLMPLLSFVPAMELAAPVLLAASRVRFTSPRIVFRFLLRRWLGFQVVERKGLGTE